MYSSGYDLFLISNRPNFRNLAAVLEGATPERPTLFEFFLNERLYTKLSGLPNRPEKGELYASLRLACAFSRAGYDYVTLMCPWSFPLAQAAQMKCSRPLNHPSYLAGWDTLARYPWPDPAAYSYEYLKVLEDFLPKGMGVLMCGPDGVLETATALVGYENLCLLLYDDPDLAQAIFDRIGEITLEFYRRVLQYPVVRGIISSDDWGFATQTLLAPDQLRRYIFPWHKRYVSLAHGQGRYAILHSCGVYMPILPDILAMGFDARHSYEDKIVPVEEAYRVLQGKIAVLGGIDVDFLASRSSAEIEERARSLLLQTGGRGYALGSGNSIPDYVPDEHYFAMLRGAGIDLKDLDA